MQTHITPLLPSLNINKMLTFFILTACITFGLFTLMHKLISNNDFVYLPEEPRVIIDLFSKFEEESLITEPKIRPTHLPPSSPNHYPK
jgi:hypothetical protein